MGLEHSERAAYQTRSLTRALSILDAFGTERRSLTVKEIRLLLDLPKPTVSRLARELRRAGLLRSVAGKYELGPKTYELGSLFVRQHRFDEVGRPHLEALAANTLQTACWRSSQAETSSTCWLRALRLRFTMSQRSGAEHLPTPLALARRSCQKCRVAMWQSFQ